MSARRTSVPPSPVSTTSTTSGDRRRRSKRRREVSRQENLKIREILTSVQQVEKKMPTNGLQIISLTLLVTKMD